MQRRDLKLIIVIPTKMDKYFRYNFVPRTKSIDRSVVQKVRIRSNNLLYHSSDDRVSWHKSNRRIARSSDTCREVWSKKNDPGG